MSPNRALVVFINYFKKRKIYAELGFALKLVNLVEWHLKTARRYFQSDKLVAPVHPSLLVAVMSSLIISYSFKLQADKAGKIYIFGVANL